MRPMRRNYFSNPRLQLTLIFGANALALIFATLLVTLALMAKSHMENYATGLNLVPAHPALAFIAEREREFDSICIALGIFHFLAFNLAAIFLSHRVAGPLYRLQRHLEDVGSGKDPVDVRLRKGDLFQSLAEACNKVMARLRGATSTS